MIDRRLCALLLASSVVAADARPAFATGGCSSEAPLDRYSNHPDFLPSFAAGQLGVVLPTFVRAYLVVAYVYLAGGKLGASTQRAVVDMWLARSLAPRDAGPDPVAVWLAARKKIKNAPPPPKLEIYWFDPVCLPDAFVTAARTAERIAKQPGLDRAAWAVAQDQVFANCIAKVPSVPPALPADAPDAARAERDYQIASACLYLGDHAQAALRFTRIAADKTSPWAPWGIYLAARAHIRRSLFGTTSKGLDDARPLLEGLVSDASAPEMQRRARALLGLVLLRREPGPQLRRIAAALHDDSPSFVTLLGDYLLGLDLLLKDGRDSSQIALAPAELPALVADDEMTDWILTFQRGKAKLDHALARWDEKHAAPWLLAALAAVESDHPRARELIDAAAKLPRSSPAYDTAVHETLRLLGSSANVRQRLDEELERRAGDPPSSFGNQLLAMRLAAARSLAEALPYVERFALANDECGFPAAAGEPPPAHAQAPRFLARSFGDLLERHAPLSRLVALLDDPAFPAGPRADLAAMAYARAELLGDGDPAARAIADKLGTPGDAVPEARRFAFALRLLGGEPLSPQGLQAHGLWCPVEDRDSDDWKASLEDARRLLPADEVKQGEIERARLEKAGGGALGVIVQATLAHADAHPDDPRLPQVLFDINKASRYLHCNATEWSKKAYLYMHKQFPKHPLTKKVNYWY